MVAYLRELEAPTNGAENCAHPPPLPTGVEVSYSAMDENADLPVDDTLRRKIEELAERGDFESAESQAELRELVMGALRGDGEVESDRNVRARQDDI